MTVISVLWRRFKRQFLQFLDWWRDVQLNIFLYYIFLKKDSLNHQNPSESSEATGSFFVPFHVLWWQWIDNKGFKIQFCVPRIAGSLQAQSNEVPGFVDVWDLFSHFGLNRDQSISSPLFLGKGGMFVPEIPPIPSRLQRFLVELSSCFISPSVFDKRSIWEDGLGL